MITAFAHTARTASATLIVSLVNDSWIVVYMDAQGVGSRKVTERCGEDDPFCLFEQDDDAAALLRESLNADTGAWLSWAYGFMSTQDTVDVLAGFVHQRAAQRAFDAADAEQYVQDILAEERYCTEGRS